MINAIIAWCVRNQFVVVIGSLFFLVGGIVALRNVNLDAIPDLSDVQVIVFTEWPGRAPTLVEDQITYPIVSTLAEQMLKIISPKVKFKKDEK